MSTTTTNFGWTIPSDTDLVKDGAAAIRTLGQGIDTSMADLEGGTTGQVLSKASNADMDFTWVAIDPLVILDAKGDLISATAADTPARLAVGTNGQVLTADSTAATGIKWATPAGGGKILQVVMAQYGTETSSSTTTFADTGLTATITPSSASSKILVIVNQLGVAKNAGNSAAACSLKLFRDATSILQFADGAAYTGTSVVNFAGGVGTTYLDSPATTSAVTYKTQFAATAAGTAVVQAYTTVSGGSVSTITLMEVGA